jgi:hypothetical protein
MTIKSVLFSRFWSNLCHVLVIVKTGPVHGSAEEVKNVKVNYKEMDRRTDGQIDGLNGYKTEAHGPHHSPE